MGDVHIEFAGPLSRNYGNILSRNFRTTVKYIPVCRYLSTGYVLGSTKMVN